MPIKDQEIPNKFERAKGMLKNPPLRIWIEVKKNPMDGRKRFESYVIRSLIQQSSSDRFGQLLD